jgi:DNA topoisomerase-1
VQAAAPAPVVKKEKPAPVKMKTEVKKKKSASSSSSSSSSSSRSSSSSSSSSSSKKSSSSSSKSKKMPAKPTGKLKELTKQELLDQAMKAYKWWEHPDLPEGQTWKTLEHNALCFPPEYKPHHVPLYHKGAPVELTPECEELATFYAMCPEDGPQLGNGETRPVFRQNFFEDFRKALGKDHEIKKFNDLDFSRIREHIDKEKLIKKAATVDEKAAAKEEKMALQGKFGFALVDGHLEKVGNTMAEPPSLFRGRGKHPLMGKVKQRIMPEQVSINIGQKAKVPICPQPGHAWGRVQHDNSVTWLASWNENILGNNKYVMLAAQSSFKGKSDRDKYGKAMRLKGAIDKVMMYYSLVVGFVGWLILVDWL